MSQHITDNDDDCGIGQLFIFVCKRPKIESVRILHLCPVGLFVVKASRTKRAWKLKTSQTTPFWIFCDSQIHLWIQPCPETHICPNKCRIPSASKTSPVPTSLATVQSHMPNINFVVTSVTLVTLTFPFRTLHYPVLF